MAPPLKVAIVGTGNASDLLLGPGFRRRIVDGIFTGLHERGATHFALLGAFAPQALLARAYDHADREGYLCHELGDSSLVMDAIERSASGGRQD